MFFSIVISVDSMRSIGVSRLVKAGGIVDHTENGVQSWFRVPAVLLLGAALSYFLLPDHILISVVLGGCAVVAVSYTHLTLPTTPYV